MSKVIKNQRNKRRLLTLGLIPVLAITLSSCSPTEVNTLDTSATYMQVGDYTVTNGDVWNNLKWSASSLLDDYKEEVVLQVQLDDIKATLADPNSENYNYYVKRLQNYILENVYGFSFSLEDHDEELADLEPETKNQNIQEFADTVYTNYRVNITSSEIITALSNDDLDSLSPLYELYYNSLATELFAREKLNEEIEEKNNEDAEDDDEDTVGYFSKSDITTKYEDEYLNQGDVDVIMIRFASEDELNNTLRAFGIYVEDETYYYLTDTASLSYTEYLSYYEDFDLDEANSNEYLNLDASYGHSIILQLFIAMYNYIYTYREPIINYKNSTSNFENVNIIDQRQVTEEIVSFYDSENLVYNADSDDARLAEIINAAKATEAIDYIHYTVDDIKDIDDADTMYNYIYETLKTPAELEDDEDNDRFSYPSVAASVDSYSYFVFKIDQTKTDNDSIYSSSLSTSELYDAICEKEDLYNSIIQDLTDDELTSSYISTQLSNAVAEVEVKIYDEAMEISYSLNNSDYNKTLSKAPDTNTLATVSYDGRSVNAYLTTEEKDGVWDVLEYRQGLTAAANIISRQMIKNTEEYKAIPEDVVDNFYTTLEYILASFANDSLSSSGYPSSIGKYNFLMLYYHTSDIDEIVNDVFKVSYVSQNILVDYSSDEIVNFFNEYSTKAYNNYFNITAQQLSVYLDTNEDNEPDAIDDWSNQSVALPDGTTTTYGAVAQELIETIYNLVALSSESHSDAISSIVSDYNSSSRYNNHEGGQFDTTTDGYYDPIGNEWIFSKYKRLGLAVSVEEVTVTNSSTDVDVETKDNLYQLYQSVDLKMGDNNFPNSYLPDLTNIFETEDSYDYYIITSASGPTSAKFEASDDTYGLFANLYYMYNENIITIENVYNDTDILNNNQIKAYLLEYLNNSSSNLLPSAISDSLTNYLAPVYTRFTADGTQYEIIINYICGGNLSQLTFGDASNSERLQSLLEVNRRAADDYVYYGSNEEHYNNFYGWWDSITDLFGGNN